LAGMELGVTAALGQQLGVGSHLNDAPLFQNHNAVSIFDGGEPVGNHQDCALLYEAL